MHWSVWRKICILVVFVPLRVCGGEPLLWKPSSETESLLWKPSSDIVSLLWRPFTDDETGRRAVCCVEREWEGDGFIEVGNIIYDQNNLNAGYTNGTVHMGYSVSRQRLYMYYDVWNLNTVFPEQHTLETILYDFRTGVGYNAAYGRCNKINLPTKMPQQCIPGYAQLVSTGTVGSGCTAETLSTYTYSKADADDIPWQIRASVVKEKRRHKRICNPVRVSYFGTVNRNTTARLYTFTFTDIGPITNKTIFRIPDECK